MLPILWSHPIQIHAETEQVDVSRPEDLIGLGIADVSHRRLVGQHPFDLNAMPAQPLAEALERECRIGCPVPHDQRKSTLLSFD